jgi:hypothetical protein
MADLTLEKVRDGIKALQDPALPLTKEERKATKTFLRRQLLVQKKKMMSLGDLSMAVSQAVRDASPAGQARAAEMSSSAVPDYWYVDDLYPGAVVICTNSGHWSIPYSINEDDTITLASRDKWVQVKENPNKWIPVTSS